jgi:LETM1 and EF-hand domain-containing protein 1
VCAPKDASETAASAAKSATLTPPAPVAPGSLAAKRAWVVKTWEYVKHEAHHYYMGSVLLYKDVRTAVPLLQRVLLGHDLSRREHNLLVRVVADMTRCD